MEFIRKNTYKICNAVLGLSALAMALFICWFLRNTVLGCHDSMVDFVTARMNDFGFLYKNTMDFCLARGRASFLFPLVVTIRQILDKTGNYTIIWLVQQVPIWTAVGIISWIVAKKTRPYYGFFFACFFSAFIQIDLNHNLMTCYPVDFMYGIAMMAVGIWLYDSWFSHLKDGKKTNVIRIILSCFCYYESMQTYEPFIMACFIYILISVAYAVKERKEYGVKKSIGRCILHLLPHGGTGLLFVGILAYLKAHPVVDMPLTSDGGLGHFQGFVATWKTFTFSLLPLTHAQNSGQSFNPVHVVTSSTRLALAFGLMMAVATAMLCVCAVKDYQKKDKDERKSLNIRLALLSASGLLEALTFSIPHAMTSNYQYWVLGLNATGYVPSSICYFGWALFLSCLGCLIVNFFAGRKVLLYVPSYAIAVCGLALAATITSNINHFYREVPAATGSQISYRSQAFFAFFTSDIAEESTADVFYVPEYSGLHLDISRSDVYTDYELGRDATLINDYAVLSDTYTPGYEYAEFRYVEYADAGYYVVIDNAYMPEKQWVTTGDIVFVTSYPAKYEITYYDSEACCDVTTQIDADRLTTYVIENDNKVKVGSIAVNLLGVD
ncbi:MAG: hypothetical protein K6F45_06340 [Saccharofermentans sp.]|nr:hypothetical protein [Saccharofermentans sp.]